MFIIPGGGGDISVWHCIGNGCEGAKKGCKISVKESDLKLQYPHTSGMQKCEGHLQTIQTSDKEDQIEEMLEDDEGSSVLPEEDYNFKMFD